MSDYPEVDRLDRIHRYHEAMLHTLRDASGHVGSAVRALREGHAHVDLIAHAEAYLGELARFTGDAVAHEREAAAAVAAACRKPTVRKGPASYHAGPTETIVEFSDGKSGGLISIRRNAADKLVLDVYRQDADVEVRVGKGES
jgi:hypothetical protein